MVGCSHLHVNEHIVNEKAWNGNDSVTTAESFQWRNGAPVIITTGDAGRFKRRDLHGRDGGKEWGMIGFFFI